MTCLWSRRKFLQAAGVAAGMLAAGRDGWLQGGVPSFSGEAAAQGAGATVAVASGAGPGENARKAVAALGGIHSFVSRGDVVVLKPNIGWDRTPEQAANTNPDVVVAVAEMCLSAGAKEVRVFDRSCNEPRRCYANSGIPAALEAFARKHGASDVLRVYHVEDRKFQRTSIPGALVMKEWALYRDAMEADRIINIPIAKHHSLATVTLGLKNLMGIMGGNRGQIHFNLPECLVDLHRRVRTRLTVIDATRVLVRNGPTGGNLDDVRAVGKIFASADVVAADVVAAEKIFGMKALDVAHIRKALDAGLGISSAAQVRVVEA
ncbi:MAG: cytoplasmic protein [Deltaproteobacteria bacterium]|nr:MAG: cytoplasmic protein [Deltaproteobacteria bacterium]